MHRKYFFSVLLLALLSLLLIFVFFQQKPTKHESQNIQSPRPPFRASIIGVGIVEPKSGNIYIGNPFNRIVKKVNVTVNQHVKKDDLLFQLDHKDLNAALQVKRKELAKAQARLHKLEALPRQEDLLIAKEALKQAQAEADASKKQYEMTLDLPSPHSISQEEQDRRLYKYHIASAQLQEQQARLKKIEAGAWQPDLNIALQEVKQAQADLDALETEIQRMSIRAPIDGTVLQIKIREGETSGSDPYKTLMILGNLDELYLRVSIDQYNAPFLQPNASAVAYRQGHHSTAFPLQWVHLEPFMVQKKYLTNSAAEKVDSQVLEIVYRIAQKEPPLFIGEQMDVFIDRKAN
jgi:HlyD family secretion protein